MAHCVSHASTRLKGDPAVNHVLDCRVERESAWTRKKSVTVRAEEVYQESLEFNTVAGIIPEGERWEKQRQKKIEEVKQSVKDKVNFDNEKEQTKSKEFGVCAVVNFPCHSGAQV